MNGYRSIIGGNNGEYTVAVNNAGVRTLLPGSCFEMYKDNATFNGNVVIGSNVNNCRNMIANCPNFAGNIYFQTTGSVEVMDMLNDTNASLRKNVYCNSNMGNLITKNIAGPYSGVNWTDITNGWYSSDLNIYIYNNYEP